jgi:hypothetical protein
MLGIALSRDAPSPQHGGMPRMSLMPLMRSTPGFRMAARRPPDREALSRAERDSSLRSE